MRRSTLVPALLFALAVSALQAQEQSIAIKDAPSVVIQNASARFPNAKVAGVAREKAEDGQQVYEVTLQQEGRNIDVTTTLEGKLALIEKEIKRTDLPAAVVKLLREKYPRATYRLVEEVTKVEGSAETLSFYEVLLLDAGKQLLEVEVAADGSKILKVEKKKAGEPD